MAIAVIGAGMAGLSAAQELLSAGKEVRLFDKGRGPGGRMSTRWVELNGQQVRFDHGAQYLTARSDQFQSVLEGWVESGVAAEWQAQIVDLDHHGQAKPRPKQKRYVGTPGMNGIIRHLASDLDVKWGMRVIDIQKTSGQWRLVFEDGRAEDGFEAVILAIPAEQLPPLTRQCAPEIAKVAERIQSEPCWTTLAVFKDRVPAEWQAARTSEGAVAWIANNASKPQRGDFEAWVLQASANWSRTHLEDDKDAITDACLRRFAI
ncbi:NAD(P)-binding protein [Hyphomonas sp. FCG-A18]|uniref:NAD(P)/FAD-dependent oxidoreductase n=1 Tax=Hyphomonas sp. FCG-A18 TaxID=3080019 RepID=UPI002B2D7F2C|nr:NAD(P)-binding protein [Hyphomonas sp. FCG-A18]